jgi:hypothetical protein
MMLCRSRLERAMRSSLVTTTVLPDTSVFVIFASSWRPFVDLPDTFSA